MRTASIAKGGPRPTRRAQKSRPIKRAGKRAAPRAPLQRPTDQPLELSRIGDAGSYRDDLSAARNDDESGQRVHGIRSCCSASPILYDWIGQSPRRSECLGIPWSGPSVSTPTTTSPRSRQRRATWSMIGACTRHGSHQVAQKSSKTGCPRRSPSRILVASSLVAVPFATSGSVQSGASWPTPAGCSGLRTRGSNAKPPTNMSTNPSAPMVDRDDPAVLAAAVRALPKVESPLIVEWG